MRLSIEVAGDRQIEREILRVGRFATHAKPAFVAIGDMLIQEEREQFETQGHHASGGWTALAPSTLESKRRRGMRLQILQETGSLLNSLTNRHDPNMVFEATDRQLIFGSHLRYALYHQTGTSRMPRRRPIELTEAARREAVKILQRWILVGEIA